jgi:hypothetical protein
VRRSPRLISTKAARLRRKERKDKRDRGECRDCKRPAKIKPNGLPGLLCAEHAAFDLARKAGAIPNTVPKITRRNPTA